MGEGSLAKVFLHFPQRWWPSGDDFSLNLAWSREETDSDDWRAKVYSFNGVAGHQNLLLCWITGRGAKVADRMTDEKVREIEP